MKLVVAVVGRARHPALAPAAHDYETRAARYWPLEVREVKEESGAASAATVERLAARLTALARQSLDLNWEAIRGADAVD